MIRQRHLLKLAIVAAVAVAAAGFAITHGQALSHAEGRDGKATAQKAALVVTVTTPVARDLPIRLSAQGHLVALNQVDVRPQVAGVIRSVDFHEGDTMRVGQLLFTLDATEAEAQLARTRGTAANVQAQLDDAVRVLKRSQELLSEKFISQSAVDSAVSKVESLRGQLRTAQADIDNAMAQVAHTRIVSPLAGKAGALNVHVGSLAQPAAAQPLVVLAQFDPIGAEFSLPEDNLSAVLAARDAGAVSVSLNLPGGQRVAGQLSFINNTVTTGSGTITLKATFRNSREKLWPGAFVTVTLEAGSSRGAMVLPPEAILEGPKGSFVYTLDASNRALVHPVKVLRIQERQAVIEGLGAGARVVLQGNQSVVPGAVVAVAAAPNVAAQ
ncbi:MAG TPA: efflux RND transporter periplasmic adaptor subunit [Usitatibacter sp.]|jgi:RND family efflux transporter MFP subunit|nr:efflux RND transporter periplasmic adaptor subunit [Usitatibacter sp.]